MGAVARADENTNAALLCQRGGADPQDPGYRDPQPLNTPNAEKRIQLIRVEQLNPSQRKSRDHVPAFPG